MKNIELTNFEIKGIVNLLQRVDSILNSDKSYSVSILWAIDENFRKLVEIANKTEEMAQKIRNKYLDDDHSFESINENNETTRIVKPEFIDSINKEFSELYNIKNELSISTISLDDISKYEISGKDLQSIKFMIEKEEATE